MVVREHIVKNKGFGVSGSRAVKIFIGGHRYWKVYWKLPNYTLFYQLITSVQHIGTDKIDLERRVFEMEHNFFFSADLTVVKAGEDDDDFLTIYNKNENKKPEEKNIILLFFSSFLSLSVSENKIYFVIKVNF